MSKRYDGPDGVDEEEEKSDERRGSTKRRMRGKSCWNIAQAEGTASGSVASRGLLRGRGPPNWWTRTPGPPPMLKTNCGPPVVTDIRKLIPAS